MNYEDVDVKEEITEETKKMLSVFQFKKKEIDDLTKSFNSLKKLSYKTFDEFFEHIKYNGNDNKTIRFDYENQTLTLTQVVKTRIEFDYSKLQKKLDKDVLKEITDTKVEVIDIEGLIKVMKANGVKMSDVQHTLNITKTINEQKLNEMESVGTIKRKDIEGCYEVKQGSPYYQVRQK